MHFMMCVVLEILLYFSLFHLAQPQGLQPTCSNIDREALLGFKAKIVKDTTGLLSTWTSKDCCGGGWEGIDCDPSTGRVIRLILQRPSSYKDVGIYMKGTLSTSLGNLSFLEVMIISGMKRISGPIPQSFEKLNKLTQLILDDNALQGVLQNSVLVHLTKLQTLSLSGNSFSGEIPPTMGNLKELLQLNLAKNSLTGSFPSTLANLKSLQALDVGYNSLSGLIPDFLGVGLLNLTYLDLSNNRLSGQMPDSLCNLVKLSALSLDHNQLVGRIPYLIGNMKSLSTLSLGSNRLSGQIPESLGHLQNLWNVSLSGNELVGPLPTSAFSKGLPSLLSIDLSRNKFNLGTVPEWIRNRELSNVQLAGCSLSGILPNFTKPESLNSIDLSDNYFSDGLSNFLARMSNIQNVKLSNNKLKSDISQIRLPDGLSSLDLHSNKLFGSLSRILSNKTSKFLEIVDVSNNQISGTIPEISSTLNLKVLNIANNKISGHIPISISNLNALEKLDISRNQITGTIPPSLGLVLKLHWLDISINGLTGRIPESLMGIEALQHVNFRANRLCGQIPQKRPFNIFPPAAYAHNLCLCGKPLPPCKGKQKETGQ
ncbi:transmembrane signal receptor [Lithospermum erythrorhizon]|uniref:Transmembrane signal receptor n=1 Tax=Lithospermum erythrorhizon TaxID=34254 RepID=A0AAV3Q1H0_LITER